MSGFIQSGRFGGAAFSPLDLAGLVLWLDASDAGSITESGGAVSQWNDLSGNGYHVSQATAGAKPGTGAATQNGLNVLTFDGGDHLLHDAGSDAIDLSPMTFFIVARQDATTAAYARLLAGRVSATGTHDYVSPNFTSARQNGDSLNWNSAGTSSGTHVAYTDAVFFVYHGRSSGTTTYHALNNGTEYSAAASPPSNLRYLGVGGALTTNGNPPVVDQQLVGRVAEIILTNSDMASGDRATVWDYLKTKWGTP